MASRSRVLKLPSHEVDDRTSESGAYLAELPGATLAWLAAWTDDGLFVDFEGNPAGPLLARSLVEWRPAQIEEVLEKKTPVVLVFEQGNERKPIIVGTFQSIPKQSSIATPASVDLRGVEADGQRLEVVARDEVVLRCGEASITLRRNGRIVIKGAYVETRARGTNRIKGGNVLIN